MKTADIMKSYSTVVEAIDGLKKEGYTSDFNLHPDWIEYEPLKLKMSPEEFHVDEVHRFEGMTDPSDSTVLYAISSNKGQKGVLVDAYGAYAESISPKMIRKLTIDSSTDH